MDPILCVGLAIAVIIYGAIKDTIDINNDDTGVLKYLAETPIEEQMEIARKLGHIK